MTESTTASVPGKGATAALGSATELLLSWVEGDEPYRRSASDLLPIQLRALDERLAERRSQIRVLDQRARDVGVESINSLDDVVPLLFSHQTYKSYPDAFLAKGQWDRMNLWLGTLSTAPVTFDTSGISDVDQWIARLWAEGHHVRVSSGMAGKPSFLPWNGSDVEWHRRINVALYLWQGVTPGRNRVGLLGPRTGAIRPIDATRVAAEAFVRPDAAYYLSERPVSVVEINRLGAIRKAMIDGTISPSDLNRAEEESTARQKESEADLERMADALVRHADDAIFLRGAGDPVRLVELAAERGVSRGRFAADSVVAHRLVGPAPLGAEAVDDFFSGCLMVDSYGMTEITSAFPSCAARRYHVPAHVLPVVLDAAGERVLNPAGTTGVVTGRLALFDFTLGGRWGGVITSDEVQADFSPCGCGRAGATILRVTPNIQGRDDVDDDKLTCAGTISAYVRGIIG